MKQLIVFLLCFLPFSGIGQNKKYETKIIGKWKLEYFPVHYLVKPHHVLTQKTQNGAIISYNEVDEFGNSSGISVEMQNNLIYPLHITYTNKGHTVYSASFFNNSNRAYEIINRNLIDLYDGPSITRDIGENNIPIEKKISYKDGKDINSHILLNKLQFKNELLEGVFTSYSEIPKCKYIGNANNGYINYFEKKEENGSFQSYTIINDYLLCKEVNHTTGSDTLEHGIKLYRKLQVTNSTDFLSGHKLAVLYKDSSSFNPEHIMSLMQDEFIEQYDGTDISGRREFHFNNNNLLNGDFKGTCKIKSSALMDYYGKGENGIITELTLVISGNGLRFFTFKKEGDSYSIKYSDETFKEIKSSQEPIKKTFLITNKNYRPQSENDSHVIVDFSFNPWNAIFTVLDQENNKL